jgi:hypothetical protein
MDFEVLSGGDVATDSLWDSKGDLAVGSGPNSAVRLPVGSDGQVLVADNAEIAGIKWATVSGGGAVTAFTSLTDTPADDEGYAGYSVKVYSTDNGQEFNNSGSSELPAYLNAVKAVLFY